MKSVVLINGVESDGTVPVTDSSVLRGDGCFEVLKSYSGKAFAVDEHLDRLEMSANALRIELPDRKLLTEWVDRVSEGPDDLAVRIVVTRGSSVPGEPGESLVIVFSHPWAPFVGPVRLYPLTTPWHSAGVDWDLAGVKFLSYAPNLAASRHAVDQGFDDALMLTTEGVILEGPTFTVAWVIDGVLETPTMDLGLLDSVTRRFVLKDARSLGIDVIEGRWTLQRLAEADEVMALSSTREVQGVSDVGGVKFAEGPITAELSRAFAKRINSPAQ